MVNSIGVIVKKLLVLGGSQKSIPLIRYATSKGHDVVLCDRDTENPCKDLAAVFIHVSATDLDGVLGLRGHGGPSQGRQRDGAA